MHPRKPFRAEPQKLGEIDHSDAGKVDPVAEPIPPGAGELPARQRQLDLPFHPAGGGKPGIANQLDRTRLPRVQINPEGERVAAHPKAEERFECRPKVQHPGPGRADSSDQSVGQYMGAAVTARSYPDRPAACNRPDRTADPHSQFGGQLDPHLPA